MIKIVSESLHEWKGETEKIDNNKIDKGSYVKYKEGVGSFINGKRHYEFVNKYGVWDGNKVILNDKAKTTVYNKEYLTVVSPEEYFLNIK